MNAKRFTFILIAGLALSICGALGYWFWPRHDIARNVASFHFDEPAPPNPQTAFDTPFRNVKPGVKYVGDRACKNCHQTIHDSFHKHPMGQSALFVSDPQFKDRYDPSTHPTFKAANGREYRVEQKNGEIIHVETVTMRDQQTKFVTEAKAEIAIGSGHLGKSYLCQREGSLWQTGISWFSSNQSWDESPGFSPGRHATRSIAPGCLYCHVNDVEPIPGTFNRYREPLLGRLQASIGCERCHGPGELHVDEQLSNKSSVIPDTSIVNPKHLEPALRDAVCQQCHLIGDRRIVRRGRDIFEYRPGLPIEQFQTFFVKNAESTQKSVGQIEQLRNSRCSIASKGKMSCTSCHDPHMAPTNETKVAYFRKACLSCHQVQSCTAPQAERKQCEDSCVVCHMQTGGSSSIPHASVTDHRILRKPAPPFIASARPGNLGDIVPFHEGSRYQPEAGERTRDRGIALARKIVDDRKREPVLVSEAVTCLKSAVADHPSDSQAWEMLSRLNGMNGRWDEAEDQITKALAITPRDESILLWAAEVAYALKKNEVCLEYGQRAVEINPGNLDNRAIVGLAQIKLNQIDLAADSFRRNLELVPTHAYSRVGLAICTSRKGDSRAARKMLEQAIEMEPERAAQFREWYLDQSK
ncbi:MAG: tetratricopeptide repeat protein [Gemmataceae bacterium]